MKRLFVQILACGFAFASSLSLAAPQGDDFSSGISPAKWLVVQKSKGKMTVTGKHGHASFLDPASTTDHQQAIMMWKANPTAAEEWTVEILGHNTVPYGNGGSTLYLVALDTAAWEKGQISGFTVAMGQHSGGSSFGTTWQYPGGYTDRNIFPCTDNTLFGLRLSYQPDTQTLHAWYDSSGTGLAWTELDSITLSSMSPGMTPTSTFSFAIAGDSFYGPISEGQMWADNFSLGVPSLDPPPGPSGQFHATVNNAESVIWDLSGVPDLNLVDFAIRDKSGTETAHVTYTNAFTQGGNGKFAGAGSTMVTFKFLEVESGNWNSVDFLANYKVSGSISSAGGKARCTFQTSASGTAITGKSHLVTASAKTTLVVSNHDKTAAGTDVVSASMSGHGAAKTTSAFGPTGNLPGDGSWDLDLTLTTASNNKTISGGAVVTLSSGQTYPFSVKGTYNAPTQSSKLVLTGAALAKGASLRVTMNGSDIKMIKGKIAGQFVDTTY